MKMTERKTIVIPHVDITVDVEHFQRDAKELLRHVRPAWLPEDIHFFDMKLGFVNRILGCHRTQDTEKEDALLVRVYDFDNVGRVLDRTCEQGFQVRAHAAGVTPPIFCVFNNGIAYGYAKGRQMKWDELWDERAKRSTCQMLARLHAFDVDSVVVEDSWGTVRYPLRDPAWTNTLANCMKVINPAIWDNPNAKSLCDVIASKTALEEELKIVRSHIDRAETLNPLVLCHGDAKWENKIFDIESGNITFVDYDGAGLNFPHWDFCHLFSRHYFIQTHSCTEDSRHVDEVIIRDYIQEYLHELTYVKTGTYHDVTQQEEDEFYENTCRIYPAWCFALGTLFMSHPCFDGDVVGGATGFFEEYFKLKHRLESFSSKPTIKS